MDPIEGVNLRELVEECHVIVRKEMKDRIELGKIWASYWAEVAQKAKLERMVEKLEKRYPSSPWMRPY